MGEGNGMMIGWCGICRYKARETWVSTAAWAIWVEMVVLLICSPFSQACRLFSLQEIFGPHLGLANVGDIVGEYNQGVERLVTLEWKQC